MIPLRCRSLFACLALIAGFVALPVPGQARAGLWDDPARFADEVVRLTNAERAARGLPPLRRDTRLDRSAALFSRYMGEANFFEHVGPDGVQPGQRMETQGYDWSWWGENIAWGYRSPQDVVEGWMASPGHRANILNPKFADLGVGIAFVNGTPYMTQDFGTLRRGAPADRLAATSSPRERIKPALKPPAKAPAKAATAPAANPATRAKKKGVATGRS